MGWEQEGDGNGLSSGDTDGAFKKGGEVGQLDFKVGAVSRYALTTLYI